MRRARRLLIVLLGITGTFIIGARLTLSSTFAVHLVREQLESAYGSRVAIASVDIGFTGSDLKALQLYEAGPDAPSAPWATAGTVDAALTLWDLLRGRTTAADITLNGVAVTLRFDVDGRLLTRFPEQTTPGGEIGVIHLRGGQLTLQQEGRPDLIASDVDADLRPDGNRLVLTSTAAVPGWGPWSVEGFWDRLSNVAALSLKTPRTEFTQAQLEQLPFVSRKVWQQVRIDGRSAVDFTLRWDQGTHFRIALDVGDARLHITAIDLHADKVSARVLIEDRLVRLFNVIGRTADGAIRTAGTLDFGGASDRLHFEHVTVDRVQVRKLPASWFRKGGTFVLAGRLSGQAELDFLIGDGTTRRQGHGQGILDEVRIGLLRGPAIPLRLVPDPVKGFVIVPHAGISKLGPDAQEAPTWAVADITWPDIDVHDLLASFHVHSPLPAEGRVSLDVHAALPLDSAGDPRTYRLTGKLRSSWFRLAGTEVREVTGTLDYRDGVLAIRDVAGQIVDRLPPACGPPLDGILTGSARLEMFPARDLTASLRLEHLALASLNLPETTGSLTAAVDIRVPLEHLACAAAWTGAGHAEGANVVVKKCSIANASAGLRLGDGRVSLTQLLANVEDGELTGSAALALTAPNALAAEFALHEAGPCLLRRINADIAGRMQATATVHGQLQPFALDAEGTVTAADLQLGRARIDHLALRWKRDGDCVELSDVQAHLYEGQLTGAGQIPLTTEVTGKVELHYEDINLGAVGQQLLALPLHMHGHAAGTIDGSVKTGEAGDLNFQLHVQSPRLDVERLPTRQLEGSVAYRGGAIDYHLAGLVCGGSYHVDGRLNSGESRPSGTLKIDTLSLGRLCEELDAPAILQPLRGHLDLEFGYGFDSDRSVGTGQFVLNRLRWGERELAESIAGDLLFQKDTLQLRNVSGLLEQGLLRGQASLNLREPDRSAIEVTVDGAAPGRLLAPWPDLADRIDGALDAHLVCRLGTEWTGRLGLTLPRGSIAGIELADARLPLDFSFVPGEGRGQLELRDGSAQVAHGRALGRASLSWGSSTRLDGDVRFIDLDLRNLLRSAADAGQFGAGLLSGRLTVESDNLRSLDDVSALLDARVQQTQALEFPVLRQLTPYLAPGQSAAMFQAGDVQARLAGGVIRVQRLRLIGSLVQLMVEGTVNLAGHLNLEVSANTGRLAADLPGLPAIGAATNFLASRLVRLHVGGTVHSPAVTVEPVVGLSEEALRFFLTWAREGSRAVNGPARP